MKARSPPAQATGCPIQVGTDMLFEMIPAYLEFFGFGVATPEELTSVSLIQYRKGASLRSKMCRIALMA
jgi:hypothetical protein